MKCQKCGTKLKEGFLYCEKCGEEICIVPDFEPEIENSIIETLSAVAENVEPDSKQQESLTESLFMEDAPFISIRWACIIGIFFVLVICGLTVWLFRGNTSKMEPLQIRIDKAKNAYVNEQYKEAANLYTDILKTYTDCEILISYADCLYEMGEIDRALSNYYAAIDMDPENEMAYARIIAMYESMESYEEINTLLIKSNSEKICKQFQNYLAVTPEYNYEGGSYNRVIPLKISAASSGDVYYTLNGTDPMRYGTLYTTPIFLKSGDYTVCSVYINDFGICSDIVEEQYTIEVTKPLEPEIELLSGQYTTPQKIEVKVPKGCSVYYTTNGDVPDQNSFIYGEPIPMKEGVTNYRFVAMNEEGIYSEVVARSYQLNVETEWPAEESVTRLKWRLVQKGILVEFDGTLKDKNGKNIYVYDSLQIIENKMMHVINEYYQEGNKSRNMTGNVYCVDLSNGYVYKIITDENGNETLDPI